MNCPSCSEHDQIIGRACTKCGSTITYSVPKLSDPVISKFLDRVWEDGIISYPDPTGYSLCIE